MADPLQELGGTGSFSWSFPNSCDLEWLSSKAHFLPESDRLLKASSLLPSHSSEHMLQILCRRKVPEEGRLLQGQCWDATPGSEAQAPWGVVVMLGSEAQPLLGADDSHQGHAASCVCWLMAACRIIPSFLPSWRMRMGWRCPQFSVQWEWKQSWWCHI